MHWHLTPGPHASPTYTHHLSIITGLSAVTVNVRSETLREPLRLQSDVPSSRAEKDKSEPVSSGEMDVIFIQELWSSICIHFIFALLLQRYTPDGTSSYDQQAHNRFGAASAHSLYHPSDAQRGTHRRRATVFRGGHSSFIHLHLTDLFVRSSF